MPSTWMREILNEDGLLRGRMLRRLPVDKVRILGQAIARGQASGTVNADLDPLLLVFSALGLVMLHMATLSVWADIFQRQPISMEPCSATSPGSCCKALTRPTKSRRQTSTPQTFSPEKTMNISSLPRLRFTLSLSALLATLLAGCSRQCDQWLSKATSRESMCM